MHTLAFDALKLSEEFKTAGFDEKKAKILAEKIGTLANDRAVTREYLDFKLRELELRLTLKLGTMIVALGGILIAIKYFG